MKTLIVNGKVFTPSGIREGAAVLLEKGKIKAIEGGKTEPGLFSPEAKEKKSRSGAKVFDAKGAYVLPGFFDTHQHGGANFYSGKGIYNRKKNEFSSDEKTFRKGLFNSGVMHAKHGTTSSIISIASSPDESLARFMRVCGKAVKEGFTGGSKLLGLDMEGTYIKDSAYGGAQDPKYFKKPEIGYYEKLKKLSGDTIKRVLIAPEWGEPALKLIKHVTKTGAVAGVGHAGCSYGEFMKAYEAGVKVLVHFGNGPMSQNFKGGGIIDAAFALRDKITAEIIIDNCHVNPRWTVAFLKNFNFNIIGVTDALFFAGAPGKACEFKFGGFNVVIRDGAAWLKEKKNTLCGSCITMDTAFENFLNIIAKNEW
ncbi:MAG: amidohydrolase family protein, partial [Candidatus Firestonebacteria bacterium]